MPPQSVIRPRSIAVSCSSFFMSWYCSVVSRSEKPARVGPPGWRICDQVSPIEMPKSSVMRFEISAETSHSVAGGTSPVFDQDTVGSDISSATHGSSTASVAGKKRAPTARAGGNAMTRVAERPKPFLVPELCKGCGRCISACNKGCISMGTEINPETGLIPVILDLSQCNGCGLCFDACPEPYGSQPQSERETFQLLDPATVLGPRPSAVPQPEPCPDTAVASPEREPLVVKGTYASAVGAVLAGCRHVFGYPITPSTEGAELMAKVLPELDGVFVQAVSEVATVNMMYGAGGAGKRCMTFTSSPGFSLMLEGISYMIGAQIPAVFVNIMRAGPGLGNIGPEQADIKLVCRGLGHGNTHAIVLAPATPQEMLDISMLSFDLAFKYRNPVVIVGDGFLGQMTGKVRLPSKMVKPGIPEWAVFGDRSHRAT